MKISDVLGSDRKKYRSSKQPKQNRVMKIIEKSKISKEFKPNQNESEVEIGDDDLSPRGDKTLGENYDQQPRSIKRMDSEFNTIQKNEGDDNR